ncbi:hypothetical protein RJ639_015855 [Escallonia herrerae]|uniref:Reverse transcriptase/retrotransposon-derived protein RNase H-like domain-containing protein n=1 Tax=Escallonia herrerae TaxID=1293975 RepID=A0AA88VFD7_9ASTE|nr:hypothetical protein RJ639_015855 [Escallonia herrerae]
MAIIHAMQQSIERLQATIENPPLRPEPPRAPGISKTPEQTSHNQHATQTDNEESDGERRHPRSRRHEENYSEAYSARNTYANTCDPGVTFAAMAKGVRPGTPLQFSLNKRPPENMSDLLDRVEKYLWAEEDSTSSHQEESHYGQKRQDRPEGKNQDEPKRASAPVRGIAPLTVVIGEAPQQATHTLDFLIVKVKSSYNGILGQTAERCLPFFKALKNIKNFEWTTECQASFDTLKEYLASPPLLSKPVPGEELFLYLAVVEFSVSAVLVREEAARQLPIYYVSKILQGSEQRYPKIEKLAFALLMAARKLRP